MRCENEERDPSDSPSNEFPNSGYHSSDWPELPRAETSPSDWNSHNPSTPNPEVRVAWTGNGPQRAGSHDQFTSPGTAQVQEHQRGQNFPLSSSSTLVHPRQTTQHTHRNSLPQRTGSEDHPHQWQNLPYQQPTVSYELPLPVANPYLQQSLTRGREEGVSSDSGTTQTMNRAPEFPPYGNQTTIPQPIPFWPESRHRTSDHSTLSQSTFSSSLPVTSDRPHFGTPRIHEEHVPNVYSSNQYTSETRYEGGSDGRLALVAGTSQSYNVTSMSVNSHPFKTEEDDNIDLNRRYY